MANDMIFFKCKHCSKTKMFAKYYPTLGHGIWSESFVDWVSRHMECSPSFGGYDLAGDRCFDLFTESDSRFKELHDPEKET